MNKGYVPNRKPGANQVAASQNKVFTGCYLYVEGNSDCCFWRNFVDENSVRIVACNGWSNVVESVEKTMSVGTLCIGVVDLDFHEYIQEPDKTKANVFLTDDHDLEMMIYHSGNYRKAINQYDAGGKLNKYESEHQVQVFDEAKSIVGNIARLRIAAKKASLSLIFRHSNSKTNDFTYPDYKRILGKDYAYESDKVLVKYIIDWSKSKGAVVPLQADVEHLVAAENIANYDEWKFLNGHDMTRILYILLKGKIKISVSNTEDFERNLYVAYEKNSLEQTALYAEIQKFAQYYNIKIFK